MNTKIKDNDKLLQSLLKEVKILSDQIKILKKDMEDIKNEIKVQKVIMTHLNKEDEIIGWRMW